MNVRTKLAVSALLLAAIAGAYWLLHETGAMTTILDTNALHARVVLLAHFGSEMGSGETNRIFLAVLALGGLTLIPVGATLFRDWRARRHAALDEEPD